MSADLKAFLAQIKGQLMHMIVEIDDYVGASAVQKPKTDSEIASNFPIELTNQLVLVEQPDKWIIRFKAYVGKDLFASVARIAVDQLGGSYISAGKDSRFEVPK